jgi:serine/threonine-protein kinase
VSTQGPDRWQAVSAYLDQVLDLPEDERGPWLAALREQNPTAAADVQALLDDHRALREARFLEQTQPGMPIQAAGQTVGAYTLVVPIGQGGMGIVWLAERSDGRFDRRAAVKFLSVALAGRGEERFTREGRILASLTHPHIAQLLDAGVTVAGQPYLVLEHVDGEPIDHYCDHHGLDIEGRIKLFLEVLAGVADAHANLVVHRDIKPSNVLVGRDGHVKLLDFGIAKLLEDEEHPGTPTQLTRDGASPLTPEYAAPEQVTGAPVTTSTDVYALGVLFYILLTGRHPAAAIRSPADLVRAIVDTDPRRPSEVAPPERRRLLRGDLDTIVAKAFKKNPAERYASVTAFADDLLRYLRHEPIAARPDTLTYRAGKFVRRNRITVGLGAAAMIAAISGLVATLIQARTARTQRDYALRQLARAESINDLNNFVLTDAAPLGRPFTVNDLLARAEHIIGRQEDVDDAGKVELLVSIGRQYDSQDEDARARRVLKEAYELSRKLTERSIRARTSCALASSLSKGSELARAESLFHEGLDELPEEPLFALDRIFCLLRGSEIARDKALGHEAVALAREAENLSRHAPLKSDLLELTALMDLAESYRSAGEMREAVGAFERAGVLLASLGRDDTQRAGTLFNNWALALTQLGRPLEAEKIYRRAIDISRDDREEQTVSPVLLNNYARALKDLGRYEPAANYAERAYAKAIQAEDQVAIDQSLLVRADIYCGQGDLKRAESMMTEVEPRMRRNLRPGHPAFAAIARRQALIAAARGDLRSALNLADQEIAILQASIKAGGDGALELPVAIGRRADFELTLGRIDQAAVDAARGVTMLQASAPAEAVSAVAGRGYLTLGRALVVQGRHEEARRAFASARDHLLGALGFDHPDTVTARQLAEDGLGRR